MPEDGTFFFVGELEVTVQLPDASHDRLCHARQVLDRIGDKWTVLVVLLLSDGSMRFTELRNHLGRVAPKVLTQTLRRMEAEGLVEREVLDHVPPHVEYSLTPLGETLEKPLGAICEWAMGHLDELRDARDVRAKARAA